MKAMPIVWDKPENYRGHVILIGSFNSIMNYLKMIGHKMAGSGYAEILIEANLVTSGYLTGVLSGISYSKSLWCLKVVSECFERFIFSAFVDQLPSDSSLKSTDDETLDSFISSCFHYDRTTARKDSSLMTLINNYEAFQDCAKGTSWQDSHFLILFFWITSVGCSCFYML